MADQLPDDTVKGLFDLALHQETPHVELLAAALAGSRRIRTRRRAAYCCLGAFAVIGSVAASLAFANGMTPVPPTAVGPPSLTPTARPTSHASSPVYPSTAPPPPINTTLPGLPSTFKLSTTQLPECAGPWPVQDAAEGNEISDPTMELGPRTQQDATWDCNQSLPALRSVFPGLTVKAEATSFDFKVPVGTSKDPMPSGGYPPAYLGFFSLTSKSGVDAVVYSYIFSAKYETTFGHNTATSACKQPFTVCIGDDGYTVELDQIEADGAGFYVWAPNGDRLYFQLTPATIDEIRGAIGDGPQVPITSGKLPSMEQLQYFSGNAALVKLAEAELQHFESK